MIPLLCGSFAVRTLHSKSLANLGTAAPRRELPSADLFHRISHWRGSVSGCAGGVGAVVRSWNRSNEPSNPRGLALTTGKLFLFLGPWSPPRPCDPRAGERPNGLSP